MLLYLLFFNSVTIPFVSWATNFYFAVVLYVDLSQDLLGSKMNLRHSVKATKHVRALLTCIRCIDMVEIMAVKLPDLP